MYDAKNEIIVRTQTILMIDRKKINFFLFENVNYVLIEFIEFNEYEIKIDSNFFRSIIRVKRIYRIFYYMLNRHGQ